MRKKKKRRKKKKKEEKKKYLPTDSNLVHCHYWISGDTLRIKIAKRYREMFSQVYIRGRTTLLVMW